MADIELVIKIPEEMWKRVKEGYVPLGISKNLRNGILLLPKGNKCKWIHYDYRTICPEEHDVNNPYWRIPENKMDALKYCPYCGKEIEIEADKEE
jgi:hypothetical protein